MDFEALIDRAEDLQAELAAIPASAGKIERLKKEQDLIGSFLEETAESVAAGDVSKTEVPPVFGVIKAEAETYNKTELKGLFAEKLGDAEDESDERPPLDEWVDENLQTVSIVETTDESRPVTTYTWDFGSAGQVETERDPNGGVTHLSWSAFRERLYEAVSHDFAPPENKESEEWRAWLEPIVSERSVTKETVGERTYAIEYVASDVASSVGYLDPSDAISRGGVWVDPVDDVVDDDAEGVVELDTDEIDAIGVPTDVIRSAIDESGAASFRAVQLEVESRGLSGLDSGGVSDVARVGDDSERFWMFDPSFATPPTIRAGGREPTEAMRGPTAGPGVGAGGGGDAGVTGTIGSDPDAETDGGGPTDATDDGGDAT